MQGFNGKSGRVHVIQFVYGDCLLEGIQSYIDNEEIKNAVVIAGLGTMETCNIHSVSTTDFPVKNEYSFFGPQALGVPSVNGFIANGQPHIHITFSDYENGQITTYTGHLENESKVLCRMEIMLLEMEGVELERYVNENEIEILRPVAAEV